MHSQMVLPGGIGENGGVSWFLKHEGIFKKWRRKDGRIQARKKLCTRTPKFENAEPLWRALSIA